MTDVILTLNAGSSSIKFALFSCARPIPRQPELSGQIDGLGAQPHMRATSGRGQPLDNIDLKLSGPVDAQHQEALAFLVTWLHAHDAGWNILAVGHRVVHGGISFAEPIVVSESILDELRQLIPLAPLHQPHNLAGIDAMRSALPGVIHVACFDTAFHRSQSDLAQMFALPRALTAAGVRRYGFHGLSYEYIADVLPEHLDASRANGRVIVAHLGNGASMCAMQDRKSRATTMGFTTLDGLVMGTRTGSLDPGVLLYLIDSHGMDSKALARLLYHESGLLGVSGISQDMRTLLASDKPEAAQAVELFCYRMLGEIGAFAAVLGGLDAIVFTGGIGEHAAPVRAAVCARLGWLGLELDAAANAANAACISTTASRVAALVIPTNEEWMIAHHSAAALA